MWACSSPCCSCEAENRETVTASSELKEREQSVLSAIEASIASANAEPFSTSQLEQSSQGATGDAEPGFSQQDDEAKVALPTSIHLRVKCSPGSKLGITMDMCDHDLCLVSALKTEGCVPEWNASCPKGQDIQVFHRLISVNSQTKKTKEMVKMILHTLATGGLLTMQFTPPYSFEAKITRDTRFRSLGMETFMAKHQYLAITAFQAQGALIDWNTRSAGDVEKISTLSRIIAVNGQASTGEEMMQKMSSLEEMQLTVLNWP